MDIEDEMIEEKKVYEKKKLFIKYFLNLMFWILFFMF